MLKKTASQISSYYQKDEVVKGYDDRRFQGVGGQYINQQEIQPIIDLALEVKTDEAVLDLGAGRGRLTEPLTHISSSVFALERSASMISFLKKIVPIKRIWQQSVFDALPKKPRFGLITSLRFFEHFELHDQEKILANITRHLTKNGYVIHASVNSLSTEGLIASFFPYGRYNYFYSRQTYQELFARHGLQVVKVTGRFIFPRGVFLHLQIPGLISALIAVDKVLASWLPGCCSYQVFLLQKV